MSRSGSRCNRRLVRAVVLAAAWSARCGGGSSPTSPAAPTPASPAIPAGTVLTFTSGETASPVRGAAVTVAGTVYTTSDSGEITLAQSAPPGALVDAAAGGYLDRQTALRSTRTTRFTLWPTQSPTGLDEEFTRAIVYTTD